MELKYNHVTSNNVLICSRVCIRATPTLQKKRVSKKRTFQNCTFGPQNYYFYSFFFSVRACPKNLRFLLVAQREKTHKQILGDCLGTGCVCVWQKSVFLLFVGSFPTRERKHINEIPRQSWENPMKILLMLGSERKGASHEKFQAAPP